MKKMRNILPTAKVRRGGGLENNSNELERFTKNKNQKRIVVGSIVGILLLIGSIVLIRSYALYKEEKEFNVIQGRIPDFNYDVKLAIVVDGEKQESVPEKPETGSYIVDVVCDKGNGSWDYKNWRVQVSEFTNNTKCNVSFTTSEEEVEIPDLEIGEVNLKVASGIAKTTAAKISFTPSQNMSQIIIGGRRYGTTFTAYIEDAAGNTVASANISATAANSGVAYVNEVTITQVSCNLKKGEKYTLNIPATSTSSNAYYAFVIYA